MPGAVRVTVTFCGVDRTPCGWVPKSDWGNAESDAASRIAAVKIDAMGARAREGLKPWARETTGRDENPLRREEEKCLEDFSAGVSTGQTAAALQIMETPRE
jgi:hypothetical protein